jgi:hypothetical protein
MGTDQRNREFASDKIETLISLVGKIEAEQTLVYRRLDDIYKLMLEQDQGPYAPIHGWEALQRAKLRRK